MSTEPPATPAIDVRSVSYSFKNHLALVDIGFQVQPQALHGFVGPNGAGKTTTLKLICTLLRLQSGKVNVFGQSVKFSEKAIRQQIGFMPDHFSMYRQMTVFEYLDFFAAAYGLSVTARNRVIGDVLSLTDMGGRKHDLINGLSRGMQQRVSLARVLVNDPDLLLLDEPASGLDPRARIELMQILQELRAMGKTIFISSHILSELAELCDSVTIIDRGRVKFSGAMTQLLDRGDAHPTYRLTLGAEMDGIKDRLNALTGVSAVAKTDGKPEYLITFDWNQTNTNSLLQGVMELGGRITGFTEEKKKLNQAFLDLTEQGVR